MKQWMITFESLYLKIKSYSYTNTKPKEFKVFYVTVIFMSFFQISILSYDTKYFIIHNDRWC